MKREKHLDDERLEHIFSAESVFLKKQIPAEENPFEVNLHIILYYKAFTWVMKINSTSNSIQ